MNPTMSALKDRHLMCVRVRQHPRDGGWLVPLDSGGGGVRFPWQERKQTGGGQRCQPSPAGREKTPWTAGAWWWARFSFPERRNRTVGGKRPGRDRKLFQASPVGLRIASTSSPRHECGVHGTSGAGSCVHVMCIRSWVRTAPRSGAGVTVWLERRRPTTPWAGVHACRRSAAELYLSRGSGAIRHTRR
jgi:hypothetical protein